MKIILYLMFYLVLSGCGQSSTSLMSVASTNDPGIFVDSTFSDTLEKIFYEIKECGEFEKGNFNDVTIILMNNSFPCGGVHGDKVCWGLFVVPQTILLGNRVAFAHESLHYLGQVNNGDPYLLHDSPLFAKCVPFAGMDFTEI